MRSYTITGLMTALIISGCAVTPPPKAEEGYSAQPPAGSAPATAAIQAAPMPAPMLAPASDAFNRQQQAMEAMHQKMLAARTPAERAALMNEHMKLMQSGMAMMEQMRGAAPAAAGGMPGMGGMMGRHMQMERRMAMMEQMMQMMLDRLPADARRPKTPK
ncbi:hypothetical protein [Malikia sp.]|uniref:hypothetical protein n=1 Tax=Malikia sp. TaxID=2070706 RepID=UPI00260DC4BB|nr:hypothetical protein [Malikia sp.]MDD2729951.1 hypothetical protein [Malikia sp.]